MFNHGKYLKGVLEDFQEVTTGIITSLVANHMFQVRPEDKRTLLYEEQETAFHQTVAQILLVTSSSRKYINKAIVFLYTRVRIPYKYDWGKLKRVLRYIRGTLNLPLKIRSKRLSVIICGSMRPLPRTHNTRITLQR